MAEASLQIGIIVGYMLVALAIGVVAYRLTERTAEDYYLASRTLGTVVLLFTTFATLLSAFTFFAGPNISYSAGPEWILVMGLMDGVIFGILWYVLGYKQWLVGKANGYVTLGEMLGDRFGSLALRVLVAAISIFWLFPYVMLQQQGAGTAIEALTGGAVPYWAGAGGITLFMIGYVALSGMRGVAWTDTLQGGFMLVMVWAAFVWVASAAGGVGSATATVGDVEGNFLALGGGLYTPEYVLSTAISIAFGVTMFPQVNQRFFVADSEAVIKRTLPLWPVLVVLLFVPAFMLGAWAKGLGIQAGANENVLPLLLAEYTPAWFAALVVAGAMAAMMSSSDSMLLSGSSYFTRDVYRPLVEEASEQREAFLGRVGVAIFATLSFVASLFQPATLLDIGDTAFGGFAQLALPVMVALYWRNTTRWGMYVGIGVSQLAYIAGALLPVVEVSLPVFGAVSLGIPDTLYGWSISVWCMLLGLVLTVAFSALTSHALEEDTTLYVTSTD